MRRNLSRRCGTVGSSGEKIAARHPKSAILGASLGPSVGHPWVDLDRGIFYGKATGKRQTKKRQPTIPIPPALLGHMRRWKKNGQRWLIEWQGERVTRIDKAFRATVKDAGFSRDVIPHTTRHTGITWLAIAGVDPYEICRYAGITMEMFEQVYAHHHPDFMTGIHKGYNRHHNAETDREQTASNVTKIADYPGVQHLVHARSGDPAVRDHPLRIDDVHLVESFRLVGENAVDEQLTADNDHVEGPHSADRADRAA
jgi:hypothetical protein